MMEVGSTHGNLLSELWDESDDRETRQAASDRQQDVRWVMYPPGMTTHT